MPTGLHNIFSTTATGGTVVNKISQGITWGGADGVATVNQAGVYEITVAAIMQSSVTGTLTTFNIEVGGVSTYDANVAIHTSVDPVERSINIIRDLVANDTVEVNVDGTTTALMTNEVGSTFTIKRIA